MATMINDLSQHNYLHADVCFHSRMAYMQMTFTVTKDPRTLNNLGPLVGVTEERMVKGSGLGVCDESVINIQGVLPFFYPSPG